MVRVFCLLCLCLTFIIPVVFLSGCTATKSAAPSSLEAWLQSAPARTPIACSLNVQTAPDAINRFETLSKKISALYERIYTQAQSVQNTPTTYQNLLTTTSAKVCAPNTNETPSADIQAAITAQDQATMQELNAQRKSLSAYVRPLRDDVSISNLADRVEQIKTLAQLGSDSARLSNQLQAATEGAALILREQLNATAKK